MPFIAGIIMCYKLVTKVSLKPCWPSSLFLSDGGGGGGGGGVGGIMIDIDILILRP